MPKISSKDATIHAAQDLIHALYNTAPTSTQLTLRNAQKESLRSLAEILGKVTYPTVALRVSVSGANKEKLQQVNQEENQIRN